MRHFTNTTSRLFVIAVACFFVVAMTTSAWGQLLFEDNFDYTAGTLLTDNGWTAHSGGATNAGFIVSPGLTFPNYASSNIGGADTFRNTGQDVNRTFTAQSSGALYGACLARVDSATTGGDYFFHLAVAPVSGSFYDRVFVRRVTSGLLEFGISKNNGTVNYSDSVYALHTTYLLVVKHSFVVGDSNDVAELFVDPVPGDPEPASTVSGGDNTSKGDPSSLGGVCIRQGSSSTGPFGLIDGIRVGTTWADVVAKPVQLLNENFSYSAGALTALGGDDVSGGNWVGFSGTGNYIQVSNGSLTYSSYKSSNIGNKMEITGVASSAEDASRDLSVTMSTGTVYTGMLVKVTNTSTIPLNSSTNGDYFAGYTSSAGSFVNRLSIRQGSTANTYQLGIRGSSSAIVGWHTTDLDTGTTYLVVFSDQIVSGAANDTSKLWVNPTLGTSEPAPDTSSTSTSDGADIGKVFIRQGNSGAVTTPTASIDGIRIGTTWEYVTELAPSSASDVEAAGNETSNIDYASYQGTSIATTAGGVRVWSFKIRDGGGSPDGDANPTILSSVTIDKGPSNTVPSWGSTIREAALFNGSTKVSEVSVSSDSITFSGLSGSEVTAADDDSTTLDLYLTFRTSATDNLQYQFKIASANVAASETGSSTFSSFSDQTSSTSGDAGRVEVTATKLAFTTDPAATVPINTNFSAGVEAWDANNNLDSDFVSTVTLSVNTGSGSLSSTSGLAKSATSGGASWTDLQYNTAEGGVSIKAAASGLTDGISSTFTVSNSSAASNIVAGVLSVPATISSLVDTRAEEVSVFDFKIQDGGGSSDADALNTIINSLNIVAGPSNDISDWSAYIKNAELYDASTFIDSTSSISASSLTFSGSPLVSVPDNGSTTLTLKIYLKAPLPAGADGKLFQFQINQNSDVTVDPSGSLMVGGGSDVVGGSGTAVDVAATELAFVGTIPNTNENTNFSASANATDANGNIDKDFTDVVTFAKASGPGNLSGTTGPSAVLGVASTSDLQFDAGGTYSLSANATGLTGATSNSFIVSSPAVFKVAGPGNVPDAPMAALSVDTLDWDSPSTWTVVSGASLTGIPHSKDQVILDHTYKSGQYLIRVGPTISDSCAQITIGYPGNTDTVGVIVTHDNTAAGAAFFFGDGVAGNYDMIIADHGVFIDSKDTYLNNVKYNTTADSMWIRTGGLWYHNTPAFNTMHRILSRRFDGDYGTIEIDWNAAFGSFDISGGGNYWYPNLVLSNTQGANTYYWFGSGATTIRGNLTVNAGAKDSMNTGSPFLVHGNIVNNGEIVSTSSTVLAFAGSTAQTVSGSTPMSLGGGIITLNSSGVNLSTDLTIEGGTVQTTGDITYDSTGGGINVTRTAQGVINTGSSTIYLDPAGSMSEGANPVQGNVSATRTASQSVNETFGNIGYEINAAGGAPGATTILRKTGAGSISTGNSNQSIARYYDVTPTNNAALNATVGFYYVPSELNSITETDLLLQKSTDGGTSWSGKSGTVSTILHKITATGVNSFSRWTAASQNAPLFITHTITVRKFQDLDGDINTTGDQTAKKWRMYLYRDSVDAGTLINTQNLNSGVMTTANLEAGTYIAAEDDSLGWLHVGKKRDGSPFVGNYKYDTVTVSGGVGSTIDFFNQQVSSLEIVKFQDTDGDPNTIELVKKWHLALYKDSVSPGSLVAEADTNDLVANSLLAGTYIASEADSGAAWMRINGNQTRYDTLVIFANQAIVDTFINFRPNTIIVRKYMDADGDFNTAGDRVLKSWSLVAGPANCPDCNTLTASLLGDGTYTVSEADSNGWVNLGYLINGSPTASDTNSIEVSVAGGETKMVDFINGPPDYSIKFRTFRADSIALDKDTKGKVGKFIKRKADKVYFKYQIVVPIQGTIGENFHLEFSMNAVGAISNNFGADTLATFGPGKKFDFVFSPPLDSATVIQIEGVGLKGKPIKAKHAFGTRKKNSVTEFIMNDPKLPMPNRVNMLFETFEQGGFAATNGLLIGRDRTDSLKKYGWLLSQKYTDVLKTLSKKGVLHTGSPKGFDTFTSNGKPLVKRQKYLAPDKFNNTLLADLVALKVNIAASELQKTPAGFGELAYYDPSSPFDGMMIKDIAAYGDTLMMGYYDNLGVHQFASAVAFGELDSIVSLLNSSFEGPLDTIDFAAKLHFAGAKSLVDVPYLRQIPGMEPTIIAESKNPIAQLPDAYTLYQNYPNPFNPTTMISFDLPEQAFVTLKIYNVLGAEVATLLNHEQMDDGTQEVQFNAGALASGVYFYRIVAQGFDDDGNLLNNNFTTVKKMLLVK